VPPGGLPFQQLGRNNSETPPHTDIRGQFGSIIIPGNTTACIAAQTSIREEFHQLNQDWVIKPQPASIITTYSPFLYELHTPVKNSRPSQVVTSVWVYWKWSIGSWAPPMAENPNTPNQLSSCWARLSHPPSRAPMLATISMSLACHFTNWHNGWTRNGCPNNFTPSCLPW